MPIQLIQATINDLETVRQIGIDTFYESFASVNTEENMAHYLKTGFSVEKVASELGNADSEFHLAYDGDDLIGYLKVNHGPAQSELKDDTALEIERIYVLRAWQGLKVGQLLYNKAIDIARQQQAKSWELRASISLARLWQSQDKHHEAHSMLSEIYNWFTEGFDTKDLQEAKALLEDLGRTGVDS